MTTKVELKGEWARYWRHPEEVVNPGQTKDMRVDNDRMLTVGCNGDDSGGEVLVRDFSLEISRADVKALPGTRFSEGDIPFGTASMDIVRGSSVNVRAGGRIMAVVTHVLPIR